MTSVILKSMTDFMVIEVLKNLPKGVNLMKSSILL